MPAATLDAMLATNTIVTLPLPGIVKVPQAGVALPAVGLLVVGRVAPPAMVTEVVELKVKPLGNASEMLVLIAEPLLAAFETTML